MRLILGWESLHSLKLFMFYSSYKIPVSLCRCVSSSVLPVDGVSVDLVEVVFGVVRIPLNFAHQHNINAIFIIISILITLI